jgi:GT2 family glycosyltransferase
MFIRKPLLDIIGYFNESFFLNFEETELSYRARKFGYKAVLIPDAKIIHYTSQSFLNKGQYKYYLSTGELLFFKLCYSKAKFFSVNFLFLIGTIFRFLTKFDSTNYNLLKFIIRTNTKQPLPKTIL